MHGCLKLRPEGKENKDTISFLYSVCVQSTVIAFIITEVLKERHEASDLLIH